MILRPVHDRILVKKDSPDTVSQGGIVIPDAAAEVSTRGTVVAVGPGKYSEKTAVLIPMTVKVGDRVLMHSAAGSKVVVGGDMYYCLPEIDVWCVIDPD
jgi:chaperonin GroES